MGRALTVTSDDSESFSFFPQLIYLNVPVIELKRDLLKRTDGAPIPATAGALIRPPRGPVKS